MRTMKSPNQAETTLALVQVLGQADRCDGRQGWGAHSSCSHGSLNALACNSGNSELATTRLLGLKVGWLCLKVKGMKPSGPLKRGSTTQQTICKPRGGILSRLAHPSNSSHACRYRWGSGTSSPPNTPQCISNFKQPPADHCATPRFKECMLQNLIWSGEKSTYLTSAPYFNLQWSTISSMCTSMFAVGKAKHTCVTCGQGAFFTSLCCMLHEISKVPPRVLPKLIGHMQEVVLLHTAQVAYVGCRVVG